MGSENNLIDGRIYDTDVTSVIAAKAQLDANSELRDALTPQISQAQYNEAQRRINNRAFWNSDEGALKIWELTQPQRLLNWQKQIDKQAERYKDEARPLTALMIEMRELMRHLDAVPINYNPFDERELFKIPMFYWVDKAYWAEFAYRDIVLAESAVQHLKRQIFITSRVLGEIISMHSQKGGFTNNGTDLLISNLAIRYIQASNSDVVFGVIKPIYLNLKYVDCGFTQPAIEQLVRALHVLEEILEGKKEYLSYGGESVYGEFSLPQYDDEFNTRLTDDLIQSNMESMKSVYQQFHGSEKLEEIYQVAGMVDLARSLSHKKSGLSHEPELLPFVGGKNIEQLIRRKTDAEQQIRELTPLAVALASTLMKVYEVMPDYNDFLTKRLYDDYNDFLLNEPREGERWLMPSIPHEFAFYTDVNYLDWIFMTIQNVETLYDPIIKLSSRVYSSMQKLLSKQLEGIRYPVINPLTEEKLEAMEAVFTDDSPTLPSYYHVGLYQDLAKQRNEATSQEIDRILDLYYAQRAAEK